jgi:hypothetical protein
MLGNAMRGGLVGLTILGALAVVNAAEPQSWKLEGFAARKAGERENVSLDWDGAVSLAPRLETLQRWPAGQVWSLARDRKGTVYAGTGSDGLLIAIEPGKPAVTWFDAAEPIVQAVLVERSGRVLAATSPGGKVYRVESAGRAEVLFDPPEKYIWALAQTSQGEVLVATGDPAVVYRVSAGGKAEPLFKSEERHIRALAVGLAGDIYAGTAESAYIYRIAPSGESYVLHDAPGQEISALVVDAAGTLYASALGSPSSAPPEPHAAPQPQEPEAQEPEASATVTVTASADDEAPAAPPAAPAAPSKPARGGARGTDIFRIRSDGYPEPLWRSTTEVIYALAVDSRGDLIACAGEPATLLRIRADGRMGEWARLEGAQATQIVPAGEREWIAATSNLGSIVRLGPGPAEKGMYTSPVKDADIVSHWGRLTWETQTPRGAGLQIEVRSGNTQTPGETWSAWKPVTAADGGIIPSPAARFLQWRARLSAAGAGGPTLGIVEAYYRQRNVAPELPLVRLEDPGVVIQSIPVQPQAQGQQGGTGRRNSSTAAQRRPATTRRSFERGKQTVSWTSRDRNQDTLKYDVYYRSEKEGNWIPLKKGVEDEFYAFDTTSLPDGRYRLRVVASDRPSNSPDEALSGEAVSETLHVDNTPPRVQALRAEVRGDKVEVSFQVSDSFSPLEGAEFALNGGDWTSVSPVDGVADSTDETFRTAVESPGRGEHTVGVRAQDQMGNRGAGHVRIEIP